MLEWGVSGRPLRGTTESGDGHLVLPVPEGAFLAVVDGLGHGAAAAFAKEAALDTLRAGAEEPLPALIERCHLALRETRGVVASLARLDARAGTVEWFGVGNVTGVLLRPTPSGEWKSLAHLSPYGGILGHQLPRGSAAPRRQAVEAGDLLLFATDGLRHGFHLGMRERAARQPPLEVAHTLLSHHARDTDDAHVLVARILSLPEG
ncbi:MAG TPA: SpoIIE family protein phosphatase [Candidatus Thermoplasmatota archaeon]|nr:SpoIIE family protein phosphatase [Candidatus Thermoplasmatota archaeon]